MPHKIILLVGLALCASGIKAYFDVQQFKASSVRVNAVVDEKIPGASWNRTPITPKIVLKYEFNGGRFRVTTNAISPAYSKLEKGDSISLVLSPSNPSRFIAEPDLSRSGYLGIFLVVAGLASLFWGCAAL